MVLKLEDGSTARAEGGAVGEDPRRPARGKRARRAAKHRQPADRQRNPLDSQDRRALARPARLLPQVEDGALAFLAMVPAGCVGAGARRARQGSRRRVIPDRCDDRSRSSGRGGSAKKKGPKPSGAPEEDRPQRFTLVSTPSEIRFISTSPRDRS